MKDIIDFNQKYGKLTILKEVDSYKLPSGQLQRMFECKCDCGNNTNVRWLHLKRNIINSCGCIRKSQKGLGLTDYGKLLISMKLRCRENYKNKKYYFDKGITVCDEWANDIETFIEFCNNNGYKKGLQIDRIDNSKGYYPENCRFVSSEENINNRDYTMYVDYKGKKTCLKNILKELGKQKHYYAIYFRIKKGMTHEEAIDKPIRKKMVIQK